MQVFVTGVADSLFDVSVNLPEAAKLLKGARRAHFEGRIQDGPGRFADRSRGQREGNR